MVKTANRRFYDAIADRYEAIDGRRSPALMKYLRRQLAHIRYESPGGRLLDIGTGAGLVTRCAAGIFSQRIGIDLSPKILSSNRFANDMGIAADADRLPFSNDSFDTVICFATLHHQFAFEDLVAEVARVLKRQGIFYADHDMDLAFSKRFRLPLQLYRKLNRREIKYQRANSTITPDLYALAEYQAKGIDAKALKGFMENNGFLTTMTFHWYGLAVFTDRIWGTRSFGRGWAPLVRIWGKKL